MRLTGLMLRRKHSRNNLAVVVGHGFTNHVRKPFVTRILLPVSVNPPTHRWRVGNTFDLYSPRYAATYTHVEVHGWFERAGLERIRPVAPEGGVSYIATKPPVSAMDWD